MTDPRRNDTDPRPPYGDGPGADSWLRRRTPGYEAYQNDSWPSRPGVSPGSFGQDRGPARGALSRPDPELYMPDPYRPDDDPAFRVDETGPGPRRRDKGRNNAARRDPGRGDPGRRDPGRRDPGRGDGGGRERPDPGRRDPGRRDPGRGDGGRRGRERPEAGPPDPGWPGRDARGPQPDPSWPGRDQREFSPPDPSWPGRDARDPGSPGQSRRDGDPGRRDRDRRGRPEPDPSWPGREPGHPTPPSLGRGGPDRNGPGRGIQDQAGTVQIAAHPPRLRDGGTGHEDAVPPGAGRRRRAPAAERPSWRWGQMAGARGALIVIAAAVIGTAATAGTHHAPGYLLGGCVVAGTLAAALAVRPRAVYLLIPVPALAYLMGALTAGLIHQRSAGPGSSGLTVSVAQWFADGFVTMVAATALAAAIAIIRWLGHRNARPAAAPPEPEPVFPARPTSRTVYPSGPDSASWAAPRLDAGPTGPEPPSWPWPEEPVTQGSPARREPFPRTEPFSQPRPSARSGAPARQPQPSPRRPDPSRALPLRPPSWLDSPSDPDSPSFGSPADFGPGDLTAPGTA